MKALLAHFFAWLPQRPWYQLAFLGVLLGEAIQTTHVYQIGVPWAVQSTRIAQELSQDSAFTADSTRIVSAGGGRVINVGCGKYPA